MSDSLSSQEIRRAYGRLPKGTRLTATIWPEDGGYVAVCKELGTVSQGDTKDEAFSNLREATEGFLLYADDEEIVSRLEKSGSHADQEVRPLETHC